LHKTPHQLYRKGEPAMRFRFILGLAAIVAFATTAMSQDWICDTTITPVITPYFKVPVTFYDYHVDGSNPDFGFRATSRWDQTGLSYANISGWVDSTLSTDTKSPIRNPALQDTFLDISWNIGRLFTPWTAGTTDTFTVKFPDSIVTTYVETEIIRPDTSYDPVDSSMIITLDTLLSSEPVYDTITFPDSILISDTMFKNIVIEDSIAAYWRPNEETFDNDTDSVWVFGGTQKIDPISGLGFGNESDSTQNAGYTFRLHNKFTYKSGQQIMFGADDDAYLYINGKLAIECGGYHQVMIITLDLDSLLLADGTHLVPEQKYDIDIFFVERRQGGNYYIGGLSEFDLKGGLQNDTTYDTLIDNCVEGVRFGRNASAHPTLLGLEIPPTSRFVSFEYFSISGAKIAEKRVPVSLAKTEKVAGLPKGMYIARIRFLDAQGKALSEPSCRKMVVKR